MARDLKQILARNVRDARAELGISQDELAHMCGLHRTYVGGIERGERNISLHSLQKLASSLGRSPADLLEDKGAPHDG